MKPVVSLTKGESLASDGVGERVLLLHILTWHLGRQKQRDGAALGRKGISAYLRRLALRYAVEGMRKLVLGVFTDLLAAVLVFVVESLGSSKLLCEVVVV